VLENENAMRPTQSQQRSREEKEEEERASSLLLFPRVTIRAKQSQVGNENER
jgi:hypothetical protein